MNEPDRKPSNNQETHFKLFYGPKTKNLTVVPAAPTFDEYVQGLCDQALFRMECYIAEQQYAYEFIHGYRLIQRIEKLRLADRRFCDPFWWH